MSSRPGVAERPLPIGQALVPLAVLAVGFGVGAAFFDVGAPLLIVVLLLAATVAGLQARSRGHDWDALQACCGEKVASVLPAILILLCIGMLIGTWVLSGTIPLMVYYGLQWINPAYLVVTAFFATAAMSLVTGTSWGSAGTLGVALMGMATAIDGPLAATAGAVVSGAYFGDKLSPLSDSTNICAIGAGSNLYAHIRHMLWTAGPSFVAATLVFAWLGATPNLAGALPPDAVRLLGQIENVFQSRWPALLPPLVVATGVLCRLPAVPTMALSSCIGIGVGVAAQGFSVGQGLTAAVQGFDTSMLVELGLDPQLFAGDFATLLNRGGMISMSGTLVVILTAFLFAAGLDLSGALDALMNALLAMAEGAFGLIAATMTAGALMISLTSHGGVTALIVGGLFQRAYDLQGLARVNLSRSLEDSVTIVEPLMPWTVSALFMAGTLGVSTAAYGPWAVFCYGGPIFSLAWAAVTPWTRLAIAGPESSRATPNP